MWQRNKKTFVLAGILLIPLLSGCDKGTSDITLEINDVILPIVKTYDDKDYKNAISELESGTCPVTAEMIVDYGILRDEVRALSD